MSRDKFVVSLEKLELEKQGLPLDQRFSAAQAPIPFFFNPDCSESYVIKICLFFTFTFLS